MVRVYYVKYLCISYDEKVVGSLKTVSRFSYDKEVSKVGKDNTFIIDLQKEWVIWNTLETT